MSILLRLPRQIGARGRILPLPSCCQKLSPNINSSHFNLKFIFRPISTTIPTRIRAGLFDGHKTIEKIKRADGIPKDYTLIYRSNYQNYLYIIQGVVAFMMIGTIAVVMDMIYTAYTGKEIIPETSEEKRQRLLKEYEEEFKVLKKVKQEVADRMFAGKLETETSAPNITDVLSEEYDFYEIALLAIVQFGFIIALIKFLKTLPVRLYMNKRGHVIRIHHSAIVPFLKIKPEMVAGTLKAEARPTSETDKQSLMDKLRLKNATFNLPNGDSLLLFEHYFRTPADLNKLLGIYSEDDFFDDDEDLPRAFEKD